MTDPHKEILDLVGNTPIVKLNIESRATILAKLEYLNPGGSIKDRAALFMVEQAEEEGILGKRGTIVEASSGNQGIALAMIGAVKGYKVIITVPDRTSTEKIATLRAYGAQVYVCPDTDDLSDPDGYHAKAKEICSKTPGAFMPNQYFNKANPLAHYKTTGPEIWEQTGGSLTHFFAGMGSCGTISGVGKYLKEKNPNIKIIGVDAASSKLSSKNPKKYNVEGIGVDVITETLDMSVIDEVIPVEDSDVFSTTRKLAQKFGLLVGISSGALMHVIFNYEKKFSRNDIALIMLADSGRAYLSKLFNP